MKKIVILIVLCVVVSFGGIVSLGEINASNQNASHEKLKKVETVEFTNDGILIGKDKTQEWMKQVPLDFDFYLFEKSNKHQLIANTIGNSLGIVNFSIELTNEGKFLHIAFYNDIEDLYYYYYDQIDKGLYNRLRNHAISSEILTEDDYQRLYGGTRWFKDAISTELVSDTNIDASYKDSIGRLEEYYRVTDMRSNSQIPSMDASIKTNDFSSDSLTEQIAYSAGTSSDDPITFIVPRAYFTYEGNKIGYTGSMGYFVETVEYPSGSNRFFSEVLIWSLRTTVPTYTSDLARQVTQPEFSASYEYSENGYIFSGVEPDTVTKYDDFSNLVLKKAKSTATLKLTDTYGNDEVVYDNDEYIYSALVLNNSHIYTGQTSSLTGIASFAVSATSIAIKTFVGPIPGTYQAVLGASSLVFSVIGDSLQLSSSIATNVNISNKVVDINFIADRTRHYSVHNKFIRKISVQADANSYFGPNNHSDFENANSNFDFKVYLNSEGTNYGVSKKIEMYSYVQVVAVSFYGNNEKDERYKASKNITQEVTYYRYYRPY